MIGIQGPAAEATTLAGHGVVLALGLLLVAPMIEGRHPPAQLSAAAWHAVPATQAAAAARSRMAFEPAGPAQADEGPTGSVEWVPAPASAAAPVVPGTGGVGVQAIYDVFGNSPGLSWALRVAHCESRYNPLAINAQSGASGLFQFMPSTWTAHFASWNIWDPYAQARAALDFYNKGATNAWTCK